MSLKASAIVLTLMITAFSTSLFSTSVHAAPLDIPKLQALADQGDADSQYRLGSFYDPLALRIAWPPVDQAIEDAGITADKVKAIAWYTKAADQGHRGAVAALCMLSAKPLNLFDAKDTEAPDGSISEIAPAEGTKDDIVQALKWCRIGADKRDVHSSYPAWALGLLYARGGPSLKPNLEEGYFWLTMGPEDKFFEAVKRRLSEPRRKAVEARLSVWRKTHPASALVSPRSADPTH